jgi:hypothetical protein
MTRIARTLIVLLPLALAPACSKATATAGAEAEMAVNADLGAEAFVEEHDGGSVAWRIDDDGQVKAAVVGSAGARVKEDIGGSLAWKLPSGEVKTVPLALDAKTGLLVGAGPKLEADLTEVDYTVTVSGKPWTGVMHVPIGGTAALVTSAKAAVEVKIPEGTTGPHGGSIQVVGEDRLEMVESASGEVRVYVLDAELKPRPIEGRTIKLGFVAERPEMLVLAPATAGAYFVGTLGAAINPFKVTVALGFGGTTRVALWGYRPGVRVVAEPARAPRVNIMVNAFVETPDDVWVKAHGHGHGHGHDRDDDDRVRVDIHEHDHGDNAKVKVDIHEHDHGGGGDKAKIMIHENDHGGGGPDKVKVMVHEKEHGTDQVHVQVKSGGGGGGSKGGGGKRR